MATYPTETTEVSLPSSSTISEAQKEEAISTGIGVSTSESDVSIFKTTLPDGNHAPGADAQNKVDPSTTTSKFQFAAIVLALCLAIFLVALDNLIISTAIPAITDAFHSLDDVAWYGSAYLFTTCSFQLVFGKAYTFASPKYVFIFAIFLFEVGSAVCGAAPSSVALILGRTIAGIGSAGVFSGALIIVAGLVPLEKRAIYNAVLNSMYGIASVIGPLIGGLLTDNVSWRWCFYINLPLGGASVLVIVLVLRSKSLRLSSSGTSSQLTWRQKLAFLDIPGTTILICAVVCLLLALQWGGITYRWTNFRIPLLFTLSGVLAILFVYVQFRQPGQNATLPPHILKQRTMAAASFFTVTLAGPFFIFIYSVPIWFQAIQSTSAVRSGVLLIPMCLGVIVMSLASGAGTAWLGYYAPFFYLSTIFSSIGAGLMTTWSVDTPTAAQVGYQLIYGFGVGFAMNLPFMCASTVLAEQDVAIGTAIITFFQTLSGAVFVAVGQNVYLNRLASSLRRALPDLDPNLVLHVGATSLRDAVPAADLAVVKREYNKALTDMWVICVVLASLTALGALGIEWTNVRHVKKGDEDEHQEQGQVAKTTGNGTDA